MFGNNETLIDNWGNEKKAGWLGIKRFEGIVKINILIRSLAGWIEKAYQLHSRRNPGVI